MSKNIVSPRSVSFEDALRNLASRLTGRPAAELPRTQEAIVQYMAENVSTPDEMAEAIIHKVLARLEAAAAPVEEGSGQEPPNEEEPEKPDEGQQEPLTASTPLGVLLPPEEGEKPNTETAVATDKPKRGKSKAAK